MIGSILKPVLVAGCLLSVFGLGEISLQTPILIATAEAASRAAHQRQMCGLADFYRYLAATIEVDRISS